MVIVSASAKRAIEWINGQGFYNPFDWPLIATELGSCGYKETAEWINNNPELYIRGIHEGFITDEGIYND
jgi:hypothetical protein